MNHKILKFLPVTCRSTRLQCQSLLKPLKTPEDSKTPPPLQKVKLDTLSCPVIQLPKVLHDNIYDFLDNFPPEKIAEDGYVLSSYLRSRIGTHPVLHRPIAEIPRVDSKEIQKINKISDLYGISDIIEEMRNESQLSTDDEKKEGRKKLAILSYHPRECVALLASCAPGFYGSTYRVLREIAIRDPDFKPKSLLDYGSGMGMTIWAANSIWEDSLKSYKCVEISDYMVDLSIRLNRQREIDEDYIAGVSYSSLLPDEGNFDVVTASYTLSEFPFSNLRFKALEKLWSLTKKYLVIIDYGSIDGFNSIIMARKLLKNNKSDQVSIFAPCPQDGICPREKRYTKKYVPCTFTQPVKLAFCEGHRKAIGFSKERFSYVILSKEPKTEESKLPRVVAPLIYNNRFVTCEICTESCEIIRKNFSANIDKDVYSSIRSDIKIGDQLKLPVRKYYGHVRTILPISPSDYSHALRVVEKAANQINKIIESNEMDDPERKELDNVKDP